MKTHRFEEFDRSARVVRVFTRVRWQSANRLSQYDKHLLNRKPPRR
jgi:hypothetical protein